MGLVEDLRAYLVSAPPEHPVHPTICDRAADRIQELETEIKVLRLKRLGFIAPAPKVCRWTYDDTHCKWDTACDRAWRWAEGGFSENGANYCPHCGGRIEVNDD